MKYPGRDFVTDKSTALDLLYKQSLPGIQKYPCANPIPIDGIALPSILDGNDKKIPVVVSGRCRKCEACLQHRRNLWTARAMDEIAASGRTWFTTLTFRPEVRFLFDLRAGVHENTSCDPCDQSAGLFRLRAKAYGTEVTKFLKRLRKKGRLRYLLVCEAHKDGVPHFHMLLHEVDRFSKRKLQAAWTAGFSQFKLVSDQENAAIYVCKYLNKTALTRVRASQSYGQALTLTHITEKIETLSSLLGVQKDPQKKKDGSCEEKEIRKKSPF